MTCKNRCIPANTADARHKDLQNFFKKRVQVRSAAAPGVPVRKTACRAASHHVREGRGEEKRHENKRGREEILVLVEFVKYILCGILKKPQLARRSLTLGSDKPRQGKERVVDWFASVDPPCPCALLRLKLSGINNTAPWESIVD